MTDFYEYSKSNQEQSLNHETPYLSKKWNYINDLNNGNYTNGNQTLVQFDGSSIFNSDKLVDPSECYMVVPVVRVMSLAQAANAGPVAPAADSLTAGQEFGTTMKAGSWNLVQSVECVVDGVTVVQQTPNINQYVNFKMLSEMSPADVKSFGASLGISAIDNTQSIKYYGPAATTYMGGNGIVNNDIYSVPNATGAAAAGSNAGGLPLPAAAGIGAYNSALYDRALVSSNTTGFTASATNPNVYGTSATLSLFNQNNMNQEFLPNYQLLATYYMTWYDYAVIRLKDIIDFCGAMPLVKRMNMVLRVYFNTGVCGITNSYLGQTQLNYMSGSNTSFTNCCPFTINNLLRYTGGGSTAVNAVAGLFIQKATTTSTLGINLGLSGASSPMTSCRLYFPLVELKPTIMRDYITSNRSKKILYTNVLYQNAANISSGASYSQLVQSGVTRIKGVLIIPYMSASTHGLLTSPAVTVSFPPAISPFDTAPLTTPMSLTNLQVQIGGVNQYQNYLNYTFENFVQEVNLYSKNCGSDLCGLSCGLFNQQMWAQGYRYYYIDCSRYSDVTANEPRNVTVQFINNSLQTIDASIYVLYLDEKVVDVETGRLQN